MKKHLTMLTALLGATLAWETVAVTWTDPETGIEWTYTVNGDEAAIGTGDEYDSAVPWDTEGDIDIPAEINGYPVTRINAYAFYDSIWLAGVTIPEGVTSIGEKAFQDCSSLTNVDMSAGLMEIGGSAFSDCYSLSSVTIPEGVTSIGEKAFAYCSSLTNMTIPEGVTNIGVLAFGLCDSLTSIVIPSSVPDINDMTFVYCGLTNVTMSAGLKRIGRTAFGNCTLLSSVTIPKSVTNIGESAFSRCNGLRALDVEPGSAFYASLDGVLFDSSMKNLTQFPAGKGGAYEIPAGVTNVCGSAFSGCNGLTSVAISESVTSIGSQAFDGCSKLTEISVDPKNESYASQDGYLLTKDGATLVRSANSTKDMPAGVTSIGEYAFSSCTTQPDATIPAGVTNIGAYAFSSCKGLTSVTIPAGVTSISGGAFAQSGLKRVTIPAGVTNIELFAFYDCTDLNVAFQGNAPVTAWAFSLWDDFEGCTATVYDDTTGWGEDALWNGLVLNRIARGGIVATSGSVITIGDSAVPNEWLIGQGVAKVGDSAETVAEKMVQAGKNGISRYQSYIFGIVPESAVAAEDQLKVTIEGFDEDGVPIIGYAPTPNVPSLVSVTKLGAEQLGDDVYWYTLWSEGSARYYNFFKVQFSIQTQTW